MVWRDRNDIAGSIDMHAINNIDWSIPKGGAGSIARCIDAKEDFHLCLSCKHAIMNYDMSMAVGCNRRIYAMKHLWVHMQHNNIEEWEGRSKQEIADTVNLLIARGNSERDSGVIKMSLDNQDDTKPSKGERPKGKLNTIKENSGEEE